LGTTFIGVLLNLLLAWRGNNGFLLGVKTAAIKTPPPFMFGLLELFNYSIIGLISIYDKK
jgi:hypothetical protein